MFKFTVLLTQAYLRTSSMTFIFGYNHLQKSVYHQNIYMLNLNKYNKIYLLTTIQPLVSQVASIIHKFFLNKSSIIIMNDITIDDEFWSINNI